MIGYWDPNNPVSVNDDSVKVTVYKGKNSTLLAVGNFGSANQTCSLHIDYAKLGYDPLKCIIVIPAIERYQDSQRLQTLRDLNIPAKKGYLMVVKEKEK
jgi:hypothetical protein